MGFAPEDGRGTPLPPRGVRQVILFMGPWGTVKQVLPSGRDEAVADGQKAAIAGWGFEPSAVATRSHRRCEGRVQESQRAESGPGPRTECRAREKHCSRLARTVLSLLSGSAFCDEEARRFGWAGGTKVPQSVRRREKAWGSVASACHGVAREATEPWKALRAAFFTARLKSGPDTNLIAVARPGIPCLERSDVAHVVEP